MRRHASECRDSGEIIGGHNYLPSAVVELFSWQKETEASNIPLSLCGVTCTKQGMSRRRVAKHACDGCKIRKIKCTQSSPCEACLLAGIACTFVNSPKSRGPRKLKDSTLKEIQQTQQQWADTGLAAAAATAARSLGNDASSTASLL